MIFGINESEPLKKKQSNIKCEKKNQWEIYYWKSWEKWL